MKTVTSIHSSHVCTGGRGGGGGGGEMYVIVLYEEVIVYTDLDTDCELSPACWYEALWTSTECDICFAAFLSSSSLPWRPITAATCLRFNVGVMVNFFPNACESCSNSYPMCVSLSPLLVRNTRSQTGVHKLNYVLMISKHL